MLTADHGESLREHGELTHGLFAYDATLRVPLILHEPHRVGARVVSEPMRHVDILPTVLDAIDGAAPTGAAPAKTHFTDADDPKRLVDVDHQIEEVVSRYQRGDLRGAIAPRSRSARRWRSIPRWRAHNGFGVIDAERKNYDSALELDPDRPGVRQNYGTLLRELERCADSERELRLARPGSTSATRSPRSSAPCRSTM